MAIGMADSILELEKDSISFLTAEVCEIAV